MATSTPPPDLTDEYLAAQRDMPALYDRYAHRMLAFVSSRGVVGADLEDLLQDLWLRVHKKLEEGEFQGHFSGWIFRVAKNLIVDRARKPDPPGSLPPVDLKGTADTPPTVLTRLEVSEQLKRCLERLDKRDLTIVQARAAGEGYDEVCASLRIEKNTAYKIFHKATATLAECMKRAGYEPGSGDDP